MNRHPLTTITVISIEEALDLLTASFASGSQIDATEYPDVLAALTAAYHRADHADASARLGLSVLNNGVEARRTHDLARSYAERFDGPVPIELERYRQSRSARRGGHDDGSAA